MDFKISLPVKFYHTYFDYIYAPQGLNTSSKTLEKNKWKCFGPEAQVKFCLRREGGYMVAQVTSNGQSLDYALMNSNEEPKMIQFCARNPSISCKYMVSSTHMRRFQVAFGNNNDFLDANNKIISLGFVVVPAQMPNASSQPATQPAALSQCHSQTPLQSMLNLLHQKKSIGDDIFPQSQLVPDMSMNVWERVGGLARNNPVMTTPVEQDTSLVQLTDPVIGEKKALEGGSLDFTRFRDPMMPPLMIPSNGPAAKSESEILASQTCKPFSTENKNLLENQLSPLSKRNNLSTIASNSTAVQFPPLASASVPFARTQAPQTPESVPHYSVPPSQEPLPILKPAVTHPLVSAAIPRPPQEQKEQRNEKSKDPEDENSKTTTQTGVKISKKIIKRKLKDKKFLKWVSKVEKVLREMAEQKD